MTAESKDYVIANEEERTIVLNHYWPYGINLKDKNVQEDRKLLFLYSYQDPETSDNHRDATDCYPRLFTIANSCLKFFDSGNSFSVYLEMNEDLISKIPESYLECIFEYLVLKYFNGEFDDLRAGDSETSNVSNHAVAEIPDGLTFNLLEHELRTISWMKSIESYKSSEANTIYNNVLPFDSDIKLKFKFADSPYYLCSSKGTVFITTIPEIDDLKSIRFYGGILEGENRRAIVLALIHSSPCTKNTPLERARRFGNMEDLLQTNASCIICPDLLYNRWCCEAQNSNPNFKIINLFDKNDHNQYSWNDFIDADIVIIAANYLNNAFGLDYNTKKIGTQDYDELLEVKGRFRLSAIHFYRVIFDDLHKEIYGAINLNLINKVFLKFRTDYFWGFTDILTSHTIQLVVQRTERLNNLLSYNQVAEEEFISKHIRRNLHNFEFLDIDEEIIWIDFSTEELNSLKKCIRSKHDNAIKDAIVNCTKFQSNLNDNLYSPLEIRIEIENKFTKELEKLQAEFGDEKELATYESKRTEASIIRTQKSLNRFMKIISQIEDPEYRECGICSDTIDPNLLVITPCFHLFCYKCLSKDFIYSANFCPFCKIKSFRVYDCYKIRLNSPESKIKSVQTYITNLLKSDDKARVLVYNQFIDLTGFIVKSLERCGLKSIIFDGKSSPKSLEDVINFQTSNETRVMMMDLLNKVDGINFSHVTHLVLLYPFWTGCGNEVDMALEREAVELVQKFGLNHTLKLVRFVVRGTIEEELTMPRSQLNINNISKSMQY